MELQQRDLTGRYYPVLGDIDAGTESIDQGVTELTPQHAEVYLEVPRFNETTNSVESDIKNHFTSLTQPGKQFRPFSTELYNEILHSNNSKPSTCDVFEAYKGGDKKFKLPISEQYDPDGKRINLLQVDERIVKRDQMRDRGDEVEIGVKNVQANKSFVTKHQVRSAANDVVTDSIEKAVLVAEEIIKEIDTELKEKVTFSSRQHSKQFLENNKPHDDEKHLVKETNDHLPPVRESVRYYETVDAKTEMNTDEHKSVDDRKQFLIQEIKETIDTGSVREKSELFERKGNEFINEIKKCFISNERVNNEACYESNTQDRIENDLKVLAQKEAYFTGMQMIAHIKNMSGSSHRCKVLLNIFLFYLTNVMVAFSKSLPKLKLHSNCKYKRDYMYINNNYSYTTNSELYHEDNLYINENKYRRSRKLSGSEIAQTVSRIPVELTQRMDTVISEFHKKLNIKDIHRNVKHSKSKSCSRVEEVNKSVNPFKWLSAMSGEDRERVKKEIKFATLEAARRVLENRRRTSFQCYDNASELEYNVPLNRLMYIAIVESHVYTNKNAIFNDYISNSKAESAKLAEVTDYNKAQAVKTEFSGTYNMFDKSREESDTRNFKSFENEEISECLDVYATTGMEKSEINTNALLRTDYVATVTVEHKQVPRNVTLQKDHKSLQINEQAVEEKIITSATDKINDVIKQDEEYIIPAIEETIHNSMSEARNRQTKTISQNVQEDSVVITELAENLLINSEKPKVLSANEAISNETISNSSTGLDNTDNYIAEIASPLLIKDKFYIGQMHQTSDVYNTVLEDKDYITSENISTSTVKSDKHVVAQIVNEAAIHETIDQVLIDSDKVKESARKTVEENDFVSAQIMGCSTVSDIYTNFDTVKEESSNILSVEKHTIIPAIEKREFTEVQAVNTATTRETKEMEDITNIDSVTSTNIEEVPAVSVEIKELNSANILDNKVVYNTETDKYTIAEIINVATHKEVDTVFSQADTNITTFEEKNVELATTSLEMQKLGKVQSVCYATQLNINFEETESFENKMRIQPEHVTNKIDEQVANITTELREFFVINGMSIIFHNVENFELKQSQEEMANVKIEDDIFCKAQTICTPSCQDLTIFIEEVTTVNIDKVTYESAVINEEPFTVKILILATPLVSHLNVNFIEAILTDRAIIQTEMATSNEETIEFISVPATGITLYLVEECNILKIDDIKEEFTESSLEPYIFSAALPIGTSYLEGINIIYVETQLFTAEDIEKECAEINEIENVFVTALAICVALTLAMDIALDESKDFKVDENQEQFTSEILEAQVLTAALPVSTPIYTQISIILDETQVLVIVDVPEELAVPSVEDKVFVKALIMCNDISSVINIELEECEVFKHDAVNEEFTTMSTEPHVSASALPFCTSVYREIIMNYEEAKTLQIELIQNENLEITEEINMFVSAIATCVAINKIMNIDLEETGSFTAEIIKTESVLLVEESQVLTSTLPSGVPVVREIIISYSLAESLITEHLLEEKANLFVEEKYLTLAVPFCVDVICISRITLEEVKCYEVEKIDEEIASISLEPQGYFETAFTIRMATAKHLTFSDDTFEFCEGIRFTEGKSNMKIETGEFKTAYGTGKATMETMFINQYSVEGNINISPAVESAIVKIQPEVFHIATLTNNNSILKISTIENRATEYTATKKERNDITLRSQQKLVKQEEHTTLDLTEDVKLVNTQTGTETSAINTTYSISKKRNQQMEARNVLNISNVKENNVLVMKSKESQNLNKEQSKVVFNDETNLNVLVKKKEKAKVVQAYQEYNSELSLSKAKHESVSKAIKGTLILDRKRDLSELHVNEELHDRSIENEIESLEDESGVVIEDITDEEPNAVQTSNAEDNAHTEKTSQDIKLKDVLQMQNLSENLEEAKLVKQNKRYKELNANEESAALTIIKREELEIVHPVLELEQEDLTFTTITNIKATSGDIDGTINTGTLQSSEIIDGSVKQRTKVGSVKQSSSNTIKRNTLRNITTTEDEAVTQGYNDFECNSATSKVINSNVHETSLRKHSEFYDSTATVMAASFSNVSNSATMSTKSSNMSIEIGHRTEQNAGYKSIANVESIAEVQSPTTPPTPLTDEYIFRLYAPLPKSRSTTPIPRDPSPENLQTSPDEDPHISNKNLVPSIETVICERIVYSPPLPTPPTSPVYTKPGLNGGSRRQLRFIKPGLRGGSDRPPITEDEVLEVLDYTSRLTSAITETLKNIEEYKKEVGILKQAEYGSKSMEADETTTNSDQGTKNTIKAETIKEQQEETPVLHNITKETIVETSITDVENTINESLRVNKLEKNNADENENSTVIIAECDTIGVAENVDDTENDIIKITVEPPTETNLEDLKQIVKAKAEGFVPIQEEIIEEVDEVDEGDDRDDEEVAKERIASDTDDVAADLEVAKATEGSMTEDKITGSNQETSFKEVEMLKEAHIMSLTRVLSAHMLRDELSPDCQKMKTQYEGQLIRDDGEGVNREGVEDRPWTTFMQKTLPASGHKLEHFADLKKKFERSAFNSSPVPWKESASADSVGASGVPQFDEPEFSDDELKFFVAIPLESSKDGLATIIPLPSAAQRDITKIEIIEDGAKEMGRAAEDNVNEIVEKALRVAEEVRAENEIEHAANEVADSKERVELMKSQLEKDQVPRKTLDNDDDQLSAIDKNTEVVTTPKAPENVKQNTAPKPEAVEKVTTDNIAQAQSINEIRITTTDKMPVETKGGLQVIEGPDKYKKVPTPSIGAQTQKHQRTRPRPQPKFGRLNPEPRGLVLPGGRRWRRPGEEVSEESIAETILAHSEIIYGKTLGESNCHLVDFHNVQENVVPSYNKLIEYEKPPTPLDHLQRSEVYKLVHNMEQAPPKRVELLAAAISEADYRERCRSMSPNPPEVTMSGQL